MEDPRNREVKVDSWQKGDPPATCPMCYSNLWPGDSLVMEFFAPRNWWVLTHLSDRSAQKDRRYCGMAVTRLTGTEVFSWRKDA
jgi:hypothetical protein